MVDSQLFTITNNIVWLVYSWKPSIQNAERQEDFKLSQLWLHSKFQGSISLPFSVPFPPMARACMCERALVSLCDVCVKVRKGCLVFCSSTLQIITLIFSLNPLKLSASKQAPGILSVLHSPGIIDNMAIPAFMQS